VDAASARFTGAAAERIAGLLARCTFPPPGTAVTCAVSGGADSTALALLAVEAGCVVAIAHVDHGLRPGSADDAALVLRTAAVLGVPCAVHTVAVGDGPNLEARARAARYAVLPADVLTGHTADDQAETVLINLLRGAAASGLAGMRPGPTRPLLGLRRADTVEVCRLAGMTTADDESNTDPRFVRNRVRHEVLPQLADVAARDLVPVLTRQADLLRADDDLLDTLAATLDPTDARQLAAAPPPLARRAVRRWLTGLDQAGHPPDLATVERVLAVARGESTACDVAGGHRVARSRQRLSLITHDRPFA
jgi:tRNA(Ile)-lysidine synthase